MTKKEIKEANLLIALFDGWVSLGLGGNLTNIYTKEGQHLHIKDFKYHSDWNWIMPVCKKWDNLLASTPVKSNPQQWSRYSDLCDALDHKVTLYEFEPVLLQLIECVKWYNEQFNSKKNKK